MNIPSKGRLPNDILAELRGKSEGDTKWKQGRVFSLVYKVPGPGGDAHDELLQKAHALYASTNLLNPMAFSSLKKMEREIIEMAGGLFHHAGAVGTVTSGGTESILCAVAAYRDRARAKRPWILRPELVVPTTIHPAFDKAAHYFGVKLKKVPVGPDFRADVRAMAKAIGWQTIGICASAPQYAHGVVDPIEELGALAQKKGLPLHVDACVGGYILPWLEKLGRAIPRWDFRVPGVTSISADLHKFAYAGKGASTLVWRSLDDMRYQIFVATDFPGGIYASPTMIGTRPGGPIAAAWATLQSIGADGYLALAKQAADAADRFRTGLRAIPGITLLGESHSTIVSYGCVGADAYALADRLEARGWTVDRQQRPASIHLTVTANHAAIVDEYLRDVRESLAELRANPALAKSGSAPMYGMAAKMPVRRLVARNVRKMIADLYASGAAS
ncbi:MAG TPA: aminotransferase class V-fold PLP-dependent enzyme [Kofleriaceae bacterium]|nr:aminotransferase class V-fold PLP-dependent enzyme [Kofleriaceae bacterium]